MTNEPLVTLIVTPRERYSNALRCLPTLVAHTTMPHRLVYVTGHAPAYVVELLAATCRAHGYDLELRPHYLLHNEARNIGLCRATTKYVVFLDNDVMVQPGWLEALVTCAEETGADVVGPLCLYGEPEGGLVHTAGGDFRFHEAQGRRWIEEQHRHTNVDLRVKPVELVRSRCDYVEFHCLLTRRELFERIGPLDEGLSQAEHTDLALLVRDQGGTVWVEPAAVVSYLPDDPYTLSDAPMFDFFWSHERSATDLAHLAQKWRLDPASSFFRDYASHRRRQHELCRLPRAGVRPPAGVTARHHPFAQTVLQLTTRMSALGHPAWDVEAMLEACQTAAVLFDGIYRPDGKTFVAHAVGTASVLAAFGAPINVVVAGLLHSAYELGRFPAIVDGSLAGARRWLSRRIGSRAEAQTFEYWRLDFTNAKAALLDADPDRARVQMAYAVLMRIANSIEQHLDDGPLYTRDPRDVIAQKAAQNEQWLGVYRRVTELLRCEAMLDLLLTLHGEVAHRTLDHSPPPGPLAENYVFLPDSRHAIPRVVDRAADGAEPRHPGDDHAPVLKRLRPTLGAPRRTFDLGQVTADNGGGVERSEARGPITLVTDPQPWSYSGLLDISVDATLHGPAILKVALSVTKGRLGVAVLWKDSSTEFLCAEQSVEVGEPLELLFALAEVREAGCLVFRGWTSEPAEARITEIALYSVADPAPDAPGGMVTAAPMG